ncbi:MAG: hypothetical protein ACT4O5_11895 [Gammaproteobacteria bacterium]
MTFFGMTLHALLPELADPEAGLPRFAEAHLTPWLAGAVLAGLLEC